MDETLLALFPVYGLPAVALIVALGCFGIPAPSSLAILLAGSFAAAGDFSMAVVFAVCLGAALVADTLGYAVGRLGGTLAQHRFANSIGRARGFLDKHGALAVFFSRWLVSPLGPGVNLLAGGTRMPWRWFFFYDLTGEVVWVALYLSIGASFSATIVGLSQVLANATAALAFAVLAILAGWGILQLQRHHAKEHAHHSDNA